VNAIPSQELANAQKAAPSNSDAKSKDDPELATDDVPVAKTHDVA
jgi:hypothetical protein